MACRHEFSFRQSAVVKLGDDINWTSIPAPDYSKDWLWDLNRHAYFETLGFAYHYTNDEKYVRAFVALFTDWLHKNPPSIDSQNWSSAFEVGYRVNSWTWAFHLFRNSNAISDDELLALVNGIRTHCQFLYVNLEHHARNNHLLLESKALLLAAYLFPEFPESRKWQARVQPVLYREIRDQVHDDGVHGELSTHYHRVIAGELLELMLLKRKNNDQLPANIEAIIGKMIGFEANVERPDGVIPLFGDSSQHDNYARFSASLAGPRVFGIPEDESTRELDEASAWRLGGYSAEQALATIIPADQSVAFKSGGYFTMQSGDGAMYLCVDCGPFGLEYDPHHGHADALSFDLYANGRPWIIDSGVYSTHTDWPWRKYFRGTRSHNTIVVDDCDQSELLDSRRILNAASANNRRWVTSNKLDFFEGSHDGYERLNDPVTHIRSIWFVRDEYWLIFDRLSGRESHKVELNFHFPDDVDVQIEEMTAVATGADNNALSVACCSNADLQAATISGQTEPIQGWRSYNSGQKIAATTLSFQSASTLPLNICTAITPLAQPDATGPNVRFESSRHGSVAIVETTEWTDYLFRSSGQLGANSEFAGFGTNASLAFVRKPVAAGKNTYFYCDQGQVVDADGEMLTNQF